MECTIFHVAEAEIDSSEYTPEISTHAKSIYKEIEAALH